jgi:hypothetical protein
MKSTQPQLIHVWVVSWNDGHGLRQRVLDDREDAKAFLDFLQQHGCQTFSWEFE